MSSNSWSHRQAGLTLVELMIAVVIGLLIILAVTSLFLNTSRSNTQNTNFTGMQDNARFAMGQIAEDVRHAGFISDIQNPKDIDQTTLAPAMPAGTDCSAIGMLDFSSSDKLIQFGTALTSADVQGLITPCTTVNNNANLPATDNSLLLVKRSSTDAMPIATAAPIDGHFYVYSNGSNAVLAQYTAGMTPPLATTNTQMWEYMPRFYYITNNDELYRNYFDGTWHAELLAEGIERFEVEFGIDTDKDGTPNYYDDNPAATAFANVVSARVSVLARTPQPELGYVDPNTYQLGSIAYTPLGAKVAYHRAVYSTTVIIPNLRNRILLK